MTPVLRWILSFEAAAFYSAALLHAGVLARGYEHQQAATAETVIGSVLLAGALLTLVAPGVSRGVALAVQAFALLGTCVGLVMIAIGVGPRSGVDYAIHAVFVAALVSGLALAWRGEVTGPARHA
ncbi:MAG TPA: hypothetical protein VK886_23035 [Vicinamibacterales bacterium]|nr:hypothetical protein [Vicinamibacterales bacterium]